MVSCTLYDKGTDSAEFYIDDVSELDKLPNLKSNGKENLSNMNRVVAGSLAICQSGEVYILNGSNEWVLFG